MAEAVAAEEAGLHFGFAVAGNPQREALAGAAALHVHKRGVQVGLLELFVVQALADVCFAQALCLQTAFGAALVALAFGLLAGEHGMLVCGGHVGRAAD